MMYLIQVWDSRVTAHSSVKRCFVGWALRRCPWTWTEALKYFSVCWTLHYQRKSATINRQTWDTPYSYFCEHHHESSPKNLTLSSSRAIDNLQNLSHLELILMTCFVVATAKRRKKVSSSSYRIGSIVRRNEEEVTQTTNQFPSTLKCKSLTQTPLMCSLISLSPLYRFNLVFRWKSKRISIHVYTPSDCCLRASISIMGTCDRSTLHARPKAIQSEEYAYRI